MLKISTCNCEFKVKQVMLRLNFDACDPRLTRVRSLAKVFFNLIKMSKITDSIPDISHVD